MVCSTLLIISNYYFYTFKGTVFFFFMNQLLLAQRVLNSQHGCRLECKDASKDLFFYDGEFLVLEVNLLLFRFYIILTLRKQLELFLNWIASEDNLAIIMIWLECKINYYNWLSNFMYEYYAKYSISGMVNLFEMWVKSLFIFF